MKIARLSFAFVLAPLIALLSFAAPSNCPAQTWTTNSPLGAARWSHTATVLTNGSVLIAGGTYFNIAGIFHDTNGCELFDPGTGTSAFTDSMSTYRHSHTATLLPDGTVLVVGGGGDASSEVYDPVGGTWGNYAQMQDERLALTATLLGNGKVLAAGGYDESTGQELASAELYDPATGQWTTTGPVPYASDTQAAVRLNNGKVLICGGSDGSGGAITNAALYDPANGTWTYTTPLQEGRAGHTATVLSNGKVLVEGGNGGNTVEIYDPGTATWSFVASMSEGRSQAQALRLTDGRVMVVGDGNPYVEVYSPTDDQWSFVDPLPVEGYLATASILTNGDVLVTGGSESQYNGPPIATVQRYGSGVVLTPTLTVTASPADGLVPLLVQFTSPSLDSNGETVTDWFWDFGDGGTSTEQSPAHTYTSLGTFVPTLTASSGGTALTIVGPGSITVTGVTLTVSDGPMSGPFPLTVQFASTNKDSGGNTVTNWNWNFGDGTSSTAQNPTHVYQTNGNFSPSLTAYSTFSSSPLSVEGLYSIAVSTPVIPAFKTLYTFSTAFGAGPNAGLLLLGGTLYGTTSAGGSNTYGTIFSVNTDGSGFASLHSFDLGHGGRPAGNLVAAGPTLYGTAAFGGANQGGVVFALNTNGSAYSNIYQFKFSLPTPGESPLCGLVLAGGALYGTTEYGGAYDHGTVYSVPTNGVGFASLHDFVNPSGQNGNLNYDGLFPLSRLVLAGATLYGVAEGGGSFARGTVFAVETNNPGSFRVLHYFPPVDPTTQTNTDGASPFAGLAVSGDTLYGIASFGGRSGNGSIFAVNTNGTGFTNLYDFTGTNDGANPETGLLVVGNTIYGATPNGGAWTNGVLFALKTDGTGYTNLYSFTGGFDGAAPGGDLILSGHTLYGTASGGGSGQGTVFSFTLPTIISAPPPPLAIRAAGTNVVLTWSTNAVGYGLQSSTQLLVGATWNPTLPSPTVINGTNTVTNGIVGPRNFYRLSQ